jgi:hypothetical protein
VYVDSKTPMVILISTILKSRSNVSQVFILCLETKGSHRVILLADTLRRKQTMYGCEYCEGAFVYFCL